jgi:hypothetical protein
VSRAFGRDSVAAFFVHTAGRRSCVCSHDGAHAAGQSRPGHTRLRVHCHCRRRRRLPAAVYHGGDLRVLLHMLRLQSVRNAVRVSAVEPPRPTSNHYDPMRSAARVPARPRRVLKRS